jgi:predicted AlkP superfamily phosphohydrolase/phosphomutase
MILVLALDGLDPDLIERFQAEGGMPALGGIAAQGWAGRLRSTFPPVSVPAWSTFLTGVGPGRHGLFDFTRLKGGRVRFQNATDRGVPTLLELADAGGRRVCSLGIPTTYPVPTLQNGAVLAGFDSPFSGAPDGRAQSPPELWRRLRRRGVDLRTSTVPEGRKGRSWHHRAAQGILDSIHRRVEQALAVLHEGDWDLLLVHFQAADTAGHHFFRYFDPSSPRYDGSWPERASVLPEVYDALDRAVTRLGNACGACDLIVLSDHGMGPASAHVCYLNRWLEEQGFLVRRRASRDWAGSLRRFAIRGLPRELQSRVFRRLRDGPAAALESASRVGALDLQQSVAFSDESSTLPGIWVLEPGCRDELVTRLRGWEAVRRVYHRDDLYRGPLRRRAPDLLLDLRHSMLRTPPTYTGPSLRRLAAHELDGERGAGLNGAHRPEGVIFVQGKGFPGSGPLRSPWIGDLAPTLLARLDLAIPAWMEGQPLPTLAAQPSWTHDVPDTPPALPRTEMTRTDKASLERRLRALGYLG